MAIILIGTAALTAFTTTALLLRDRDANLPHNIQANPLPGKEASTEQEKGVAPVAKSKPQAEELPSDGETSSPNEAVEAVLKALEPVKVEPPTFEEGAPLYSAATPEIAAAPAITLAGGSVPFMLLCKSKVKEWGVITLYLDTVTDDMIRYRRLSTRDTVNNSGLVFSPEGDFVKREPALPPSDCETRNLFAGASSQ